MSSRREQDALLALFNSFRPSRRVPSFDQLADGKTLMEIMHSIDGNHFKTGPKSQPRSASGVNGENWVLRMNILKRLYRLLLSYPLNNANAPTLAVSTLPEPPFNLVARNPKSPEGAAGLLQICRICVAVSAMGPANERVIAKIQSLDEAAMVELMKIIEGVMATLPKDSDDDKEGETESDLLSLRISGVREDRDRLIQENEELNDKVKALNEEIAQLRHMTEYTRQEREDENRRASIEEATRTVLGPSENEVLRAELARSEETVFVTTTALEQRNNEVAVLNRTIEELTGPAAEANKLREQNEELRHIQERYVKSVNVVEKYKRKLEDTARLRRELRTLEEENAALLDKNSSLEVELRKLGASKALVENYKSQVDALEQKANEQSAEFAQITVQLEKAQASMTKMDQDRDRMRDEIQFHLERLKEQELSGGEPGDTSLSEELDVSDSELAARSKTELRLRVRALERELAEIKVPTEQSDKIRTLENLLAEATKTRERYQLDYLESNRAMLVAQAKLDAIMAGRTGNEAQTSSALRQKLDEVLNEREQLQKDKQLAETAHEELVRQLTAAKADLGLVDKDKHSIIASARDEAQTESRKFSEEVSNLKDEIQTLRERDRLHLEEIRGLMMDKITLQSAGMERNQEALERERQLNQLRATIDSGNASPASVAEIKELRDRNDNLTTEVASLHDKLRKAKAFIKNQDALFRAEHDKRLSSDFTEVQLSYESQINQLKNELSVAKHNALSVESLYRLEQQLMLSAWHDLGTRVVRDHVGATGLRRPVMPKPTPTSWLARQRDHQDHTRFSR